MKLLDIIFDRRMGYKMLIHHLRNTFCHVKFEKLCYSQKLLTLLINIEVQNITASYGTLFLLNI